MADTKRVVFLGDSLTEGVDGASYLRLLRQRATADPPPGGVELVNAGAGGDTVINLARRLRRDVLPLHPDWVVVLIGVNDCSTALAHRAPLSPRAYRSRRYFAERKGLHHAITPARFRDGLRIVVDALATQSDARIALCTPPAYGESPRSRAWRLLDEYAEVARWVAAERDCALIDLHAAFARELAALPPRPRPSPLALWRAWRLPSDEYELQARLRGYRLVYDGVHLTARGAQLVADTISPWLRAAVTPVSPHQAGSIS